MLSNDVGNQEIPTVLVWSTICCDNRSPSATMAVHHEGPNFPNEEMGVEVARYDWEIEYRPGTQIAHADALSRGALNVLCWDRFVHMKPEEFGKEQWKDHGLRKFMRYLRMIGYQKMTSWPRGSP